MEQECRNSLKHQRTEINSYKKEVDDSKKMLAKAVHKKNKSEESWHQYEASERANKEEKLDEK